MDINKKNLHSRTVYENDSTTCSSSGGRSQMRNVGACDVEVSIMWQLPLQSWACSFCCSQQAQGLLSALWTGDSPEHCGVWETGALYSSPSSTCTFTHTYTYSSTFTLILTLILTVIILYLFLYLHLYLGPNLCQ